MKSLKFLNGIYVLTLKRLTLIVFILNSNIANATSVMVKIEDMGLFDWESIQEMSPGFGSDGPITLDWDPNHDSFTELLAFNSGYSGRGAAFCWYGEDCALELSVSEIGTNLMLESFFLGYYSDNGGVVDYHVIDMETGSDILFGSPWVDGSDGSIVSVNASSSVGFRILFGPDGYDGGINDITYSYQPALVQTPIPTAVWFFGSGLIGLLSLGRKSGT